MFIGAKRRGDSNEYDAAWIDGGVVIRWFGGELKPWVFDLTLVADAFGFADSNNLKVLILSPGEWAPIEKRTAASQVAPGTVPPVDVAALGQAVAAAIKFPTYTPA